MLPSDPKSNIWKLMFKFIWKKTRINLIHFTNIQSYWSKIMWNWHIRHQRISVLNRLLYIQVDGYEMSNCLHLSLNLRYRSLCYSTRNYDRETNLDKMNEILHGCPGWVLPYIHWNPSLKWIQVHSMDSFIVCIFSVWVYLLWQKLQETQTPGLI